MPDGDPAAAVTLLSSIHDVPADAWDACAGQANPFVSHAFLSALEDSGAACAEAGWTPRHLVARGADGSVAGCVPLYVKAHSYGEYVFDWAWADAYERAGGRYYPKLQAAVPFTPVTGPRLLVRPGTPGDVGATLAGALRRIAERSGVSSAHVTFATAAECAGLAADGFLTRIGCQYHWRNEGYGAFEDFLAALTSRKRKAIRKERSEVAAAGLTIRTLTGEAIEARHWQAFYRFYRNTIDRKWAHAYLTRRFFRLLGERLGARVVLVVAETAAGTPVAAALNLLGDEALYGRYWGCDGDYRFLHFEVCYYRAIEFAIANGLRRVEAGAQGEHKIQRGYLPQPTYSAHWIADARFREAIARFLASEREAIAREMTALADASPYRRADGTG